MYMYMYTHAHAPTPPPQLGEAIIKKDYNPKAKIKLT